MNIQIIALLLIGITTISLRCMEACRDATLMQAINHASIRELDKALTLNPDLSYVNKQGHTPLLEVINNHNLSPNALKFKMIQMLINAKADINQEYYVPGVRKRVTSLSLAVLREDADLVAFLLNLKDINEIRLVDVNKRIEGTAALHLVRDGRCVSFLLAAGAAINIRDKEGCTPLHRALEYYHSEKVKILLQRCADVTLRDYKFKKRALDFIQDNYYFLNTKLDAQGKDYMRSEVGRNILRQRLRILREIAKMFKLHSLCWGKCFCKRGGWGIVEERLPEELIAKIRLYLL